MMPICWPAHASTTQVNHAVGESELPHRATTVVLAVARALGGDCAITIEAFHAGVVVETKGLGKHEGPE